MSFFPSVALLSANLLPPTVIVQLLYFAPPEAAVLLANWEYAIFPLGPSKYIAPPFLVALLFMNDDAVTLPLIPVSQYIAPPSELAVLFTKSEVIM